MTRMHGLGRKNKAQEFNTHEQEAYGENNSADPKAQVELGAEFIIGHGIIKLFEKDLESVPGPDQTDDRTDKSNKSGKDNPNRVRHSRRQHLDIDVAARTDQPG